MAERDSRPGEPNQGAPVSAGHARLATARRRAAERDRSRSELDGSMARSRVLLRVERALRQLLVPHESLEVASLVAHSGGGRRGWAVSGLALYVGDFARLDVSRVPLERIAGVGIGLDGPPFAVTVTVTGEPPRQIEDSFDGHGLEAAERLLDVLARRAGPLPAS